MKKNWLVFLTILIATLIASRDLFKPGYFPMHDDLQVGRLYQMELCFRDRQIPCRWVPDMGYSYGYPLFNYYPSFPYYLGMVFRGIGFSFIDSVKILFILGFLVSGILMYLLGKSLWGDWGGLLSSVLYIFAPYHSVDVYVRGAMNEFWAMAFLPGIYWTVYEIIERKEKKNSILWLALFFGLTLLSHNLMAFIFAPTVVIFALILIYFQKKKRGKVVVNLVKAGVLGFGLAAFFTLPVLLEKKYVHVETMLMGYFNYLAHFVGLRKTLFTRFWGYGSSGWLQDAGMPFQVGFPHWPLAALAFGLAIFWFLRKKLKIREFVIFVFYFFIFIFSLFMVHPRSILIWKTFKILEYLQFPWRFLALVIFGMSILGGGLVYLIKKEKVRWFTGIFLIISAILLNYSFFRPEKIIQISDEEKLFSAKGWNKLQTDAILDYLPKYAYQPPGGPAPEEPEIKEGKAEILAVRKGTNWYEFNVKAEEQAKIQIPLYDFPGWKVWVNGKLTRISHDNFLGLITIEVPVGEYLVKARLVDTTIRKVGNWLSLVSWLGIIGWLGTDFFFKNFKKLL